MSSNDGQHPIAVEARRPNGTLLLEIERSLSPVERVTGAEVCRALGAFQAEVFPRYAEARRRICDVPPHALFKRKTQDLFDQ